MPNLIAPLSHLLPHTHTPLTNASEYKYDDD